MRLPQPRRTGEDRPPELFWLAYNVIATIATRLRLIHLALELPAR